MQTHPYQGSELGRILDDSLNEIYIVDAKSLKFLWVNRGARENLGYTLEELQQLTPLDIKPDLSPEEFAQLVRPLRSGEQERVQFEAAHRRKDGSIYPVEVHLQQIDFEGVPVFVAIVLDITPRKHAEIEREKLIARLERKNAELERYTYTVAHDLKVPLVTLKGFLRQIEKNISAGNLTGLASDAARIVHQADAMAQLLDELLDLSMAGHVVSPPEEVSLAEIAREAAASCTGDVRHSPACIDIADDLPVVRGDRTRLREVFQNLIDNALKYSADRPDRRVEVGMRRPRGSSRAADHVERPNGGETVFFVRDNGIGVPPADAERIFDLFIRLDRRQKGSGVGLALCKRIVEGHGGQIWVESEGAGKGASFCFTLPEG